METLPKCVECMNFFVKSRLDCISRHAQDVAKSRLDCISRQAQDIAKSTVVARNLMIMSTSFSSGDDGDVGQTLST